MNKFHSFGAAVKWPGNFMSALSTGAVGGKWTTTHKDCHKGDFCLGWDSWTTKAVSSCHSILFAGTLPFFSFLPKN